MTIHKSKWSISELHDGCGDDITIRYNGEPVAKMFDGKDTRLARKVLKALQYYEALERLRKRSYIYNKGLK